MLETVFLNKFVHIRGSHRRIARLADRLQVIHLQFASRCFGNDMTAMETQLCYIRKLATHTFRLSYVFADPLAPHLAFESDRNRFLFLFFGNCCLWILRCWLRRQRKWNLRCWLRRQRKWMPATNSRLHHLASRNIDYSRSLHSLYCYCLLISVT